MCSKDDDGIANYSIAVSSVVSFPQSNVVFGLISLTFDGAEMLSECS
jgi:hypothetical protein